MVKSCVSRVISRRLSLAPSAAWHGAQQPCIVVLPVGPDASLEFLGDTIESVLHFCEPTTRIAILDDSAKGYGEKLAARYERVFSRPVHSSGLYSTNGDFWFKLSTFYRWLLENHAFAFLLRIDEDTLITGPTPETDARSYFSSHPEVGLLGQFRKQTDGVPEPNKWPRAETVRELSWTFPLQPPRRKLIARAVPRTRATQRLRFYVQQARRHGWNFGEHVPGGGYFLTRECLRHLALKDFLGDARLSASELKDDHLLSLAVAASGDQIADFSGSGQPIAFELRSLALGYEKLAQERKKIVHSVRRSGDDGEAEVRAHFRSLRSRSTKCDALGTLV